MPKEVCLCIHGHFYQPPRENAWLEQIEQQDSAAPFHDWNERIYHECYLPNTAARVVDHKGHLADIVNNFEKISFNFGPTLLSWIERKHPETYRRILNADAKSVHVHGGHGNAIAQIYNHVIMPLATRRDKITEVKWGIADFRHRFGREPESIWLSETACNEETLEVLVEEKIKFIILEPHQAEAVRTLQGDGDWRNVAEGAIDPKVPYRCFLKSDPSKFIDVFFYDGPASKDVGFGPLAFEAKMFADRISAIAAGDANETQIVSISTDGETYGHHKAFGERALAYLLNVEAPKRGFKIVNYGEFLEKHPPRFAVMIKEGENGKGTSWSCAHGVKRWEDHCGCRGDGPAEWNQHWRKPLRQSIDWLNAELGKIFETETAHYLKDVWAARNDFIEVILDRSPKATREFLFKHASHPLEKDEIVTCLKLLEAQRHSLLMQTSCAWFFTEISGIETVQVLQYAARALRLVYEATGKSLEQEFLERLAEAKSNITEFKDGREIYNRFVKPRMISLPQVVSYYAICSVFDNYYPDREKLSIYCFDLQIMHQRKESFADITLNFGKIRISSSLTQEENDYIFVAVEIGLYDFRCSVKTFRDHAEYEMIEKEFFGGLHSLHLVDFLRKIDAIMGETYYALKDLPLRERSRIIGILTREMIEKIDHVHENLFDENRRMSEIYRSLHLPIPPEIRYAVEHTLAARLMKELEELASQGFNTKKAVALNRIVESAKSFEVDIPKEKISRLLSKELDKRTKNLLQHLDPQRVVECFYIHKVAKKMNIEFDHSLAQEHVFALLKKWTENPALIPNLSEDAWNDLLALVTVLRIHADDFKKLIQKLKLSIKSESDKS